MSGLVSTAALQPPGAPQLFYPADEQRRRGDKHGNISAGVQAVGGGIGPQKATLQDALAASDPLAEASCGLTGARVCWHATLEEVCS